MFEILIDGLNLLYQDSHLKKLILKDYNKAVTELIALVNKYAIKNPKLKILIILDGLAPDDFISAQNLYVEECGKHKKADDLIKEYIRNSVNPKKMKIISSDREILNFAKLYYSEVYRSEEFIFELNLLKSDVKNDEFGKYKKIEKSDISGYFFQQFNKELTKNDLDKIKFDIPEKYIKSQKSKPQIIQTDFKKEVKKEEASVDFSKMLKEFDKKGFKVKN